MWSVMCLQKKNSLNPNWRNNGELLKQSVTFGPQKKIFCLKHGSEMNGNRALLVRLIWLVWWNLCELQVHKSYDRVNLLYCNCQWITGKNNGFPFLDILGYLKNTHKNPKFGKVRQVPTRDSLNTLKYPKMGICYFFLWMALKQDHFVLNRVIKFRVLS